MTMVRMKEGQMRFVILPLLTFLVATPVSAQSGRGLQDFSLFATVINQQIAIVELDGTTREGLVVAAGPEGVTMKFATETRTYTDTQIASAERMKDGRLDGVAKGLLWGALLGALGSQGYTSQESALGQWARGVAMFGVIGYVLDAGETHREALYRSPFVPVSGATVPKPALTLSFRF
jgi:hypothetical protein